ncbi:hypothetical protein FHS90_002990 [Rufibacter quisquiliarum]|uniref:Uncharacterized protein n=1 Tax=Rufibacter quisquiliarum TaxID=1549639 RepID=A0A839GF55_9BACT|nr:hypothetical protein [Rufibacter quisquiliarum]
MAEKGSADVVFEQHSSAMVRKKHEGRFFICRFAAQKTNANMLET